MQYHLQLRFRGAPQDIAGILPSEFGAITEVLKSAESMNTSRASIVLPKEGAEAIVAWGRQTLNNATVLAGVNLTPIYEAEDLGASDLVELCLPHDMDKIRLLNPKEAISLAWTCPNCDRTTHTQIAELEVDGLQDYAIHQTYNNEWIMPSSYIPFLEHYGLATAPIKNSPESVQVIINQTFSLSETVAPLSSYGTPCPGCGLLSLRKQRGIEGNPLDATYPGLTMYTDNPITIKPLDTSSITIARSIERIHNPRVSSTPIHNAGDPVDYRHIALYHYDSRPVFIAKAELVDQLFEAQAIGFAYRPIYIAS